MGSLARRVLSEELRAGRAEQGLWQSARPRWCCRVLPSGVWPRSSVLGMERALLAPALLAPALQSSRARRGPADVRNPRGKGQADAGVPTSLLPCHCHTATPSCPTNRALQPAGNCFLHWSSSDFDSVPPFSTCFRQCSLHLLSRLQTSLWISKAWCLFQPRNETTYTFKIIII